MSAHQQDFETIVKDAGIPTTSEAMQAEWDLLNTEQGSTIKNDSKWSPFWKLISAIVTAPALWLVQFLIHHLLPNSFVKTASGQWLEILAWGLGLSRNPAVKLQGWITFSRDQIQTAVTVPAGTRIQTPAIGGKVYELITLQDTVFADGALTQKVAACAVQAGADFNLAPGYFALLPEPVTGVTGAVNEDNWITQSGQDAESDEALRLRCRNQFTAVGQFHHDAAYKAIITAHTGLRTDYIHFEHGAPRGPGTANVYLMQDSGPVDAATIDSLNAHISTSGHHGHGDDLLAIAMPTSAAALTATVVLNDALDAGEKTALLAEIQLIIECAFRKNQGYADLVTQTAPWSLFSFSRLGEELHRALPDLVSVSFDKADISTQMALATLSNLTVQEAA